jgi:hypothetical protein
MPKGLINTCNGQSQMSHVFLVYERNATFEYHLRMQSPFSRDVSEVISSGTMRAVILLAHQRGIVLNGILANYNYSS